MQKFKFGYLLVILFLAVLTIFIDNVIFTLIFVLVVSVLWIVKEIEMKQTLDVMTNYHAEHEKDAMASIALSNQRLKELIKAIPFPMVYVNQSGILELSNLSFDKINDTQAKEIYSNSIHRPIKELMMEGFIHEKQFIKRISYNGTIYQVHSQPLFQTKQYAGCIFLFQDITRVLDGEKMQQQFIADASHELKTPISAILGMSEILNRDNFDDPATQKEFLEQIEKDARRLSTIVSDLLLQSKLKADKIYLDKSDFTLKHFFDGVLFDKRVVLFQNDIKVKLNCPSDIKIYADQFRLSQVFRNLIDNAANYAKKGTISIDCILDNLDIIITFKDTGQGIAPEHLPHIFERFYRGNIARDRKDGGSGLGLAISKSIIEAHGGTMEVQSVLGEGTAFKIVLTQS